MIVKPAQKFKPRGRPPVMRHHLSHLHRYSLFDPKKQNNTHIYQENHQSLTIQASMQKEEQACCTKDTISSIESINFH